MKRVAFVAVCVLFVLQAWPPDRLLMSDQTRREPGEDFRIRRLLQLAFLQAIFIVETDAQIFWWYGHRRQQPDCVQVDSWRLLELSADPQQVRTLGYQLGQSAWKSIVPPSEATPARAFVYGNSGDFIYFEMDDPHKGAPLTGLLEELSPPDSIPFYGYSHFLL